ncbi:hypothetical protein NPIL_254301 [Nephila pilipes]|uniref:Uncharacterized protein n=1 Tax=Nephila pilipes TaxID=299642 RepID=A0A8X6U0G5_NEPPI|nr:hypothetical protein NPIL_254301 [Nephila pilipes]
MAATAGVLQPTAAGVRYVIVLFSGGDAGNVHLLQADTLPAWRTPFGLRLEHGGVLNSQHAVAGNGNAETQQFAKRENVLCFGKRAEARYGWHKIYRTAGSARIPRCLYSYYSDSCSKYRPQRTLSNKKKRFCKTTNEELEARLLCGSKKERAVLSGRELFQGIIWLAAVPRVIIVLVRCRQPEMSWAASSWHFGCNCS